MTVPIIIKLLTSLAVIIILNRYMKNLPLSLLGGAILFAVWIGLSFRDILITIEHTVWSGDTAGLLALVSLVILLSMQMRRTGLIDELVSSVRGAFSSRASLAVLPAVIGLLPMPGGALFSAPLLDNFDDLPGVEQNLKTRINYWFRHVWEYAWPLYPGIIVACDAAGIALWQILLFGLPLSAAAILFGCVFFLSKIPKGERGTEPHHTFSIIPFIPVLTVIVLYAAIQLFAPAVGEVNQYLPMVLGLSSAVITLQVRRPLAAADWGGMILSGQIYRMLLIIIMVRVYGSFIEVDIQGVSVVQTMAQEMRQFGIPTLPLIMALPFFAGLTMGVSVGFSGAAIPVVVALLGVSPSFGTLIGTVLFAYVCGFMGTMLSPLHVCMIVTCEYYKTDLSASFRAIVSPAVSMILAAFAYMEILRLLF